MMSFPQVIYFTTYVNDVKSLFFKRFVYKFFLLSLVVIWSGIKCLLGPGNIKKYILGLGDGDKKSVKFKLWLFHGYLLYGLC